MKLRWLAMEDDVRPTCLVFVASIPELTAASHLLNKSLPWLNNDFVVHSCRLVYLRDTLALTPFYACALSVHSNKIAFTRQHVH